MKKIGVKWICCLRAESTLTNEDLELLKDSGCRMIEIGIESANQGVLDKIGKRTRLADIERILKKAAELEIIIIGMLMVPHHVDTPQTVFETVKKIEEWVNTTTLIPMAFQTMVPANTEFSKMLLGYPGIRISQDEKIMETSTVSATLIAEALRKLINLSKAACIRNAYTLAKNMDLDLSSLADNITDEMELRFKTEPVLPV
jgi:radical SAM superfamily enzyme YgiQ (UPF0313 family)